MNPLISGIAVFLVILALGRLPRFLMRARETWQYRATRYEIMRTGMLRAMKERDFALDKNEALVSRMQDLQRRFDALELAYFYKQGGVSPKRAAADRANSRGQN